MTVPAWLAVISGIVVAIATILFAVRAVVRFMRKVVHFFDDWFGEPARRGVDARPGVPERLSTLEYDMSRIKEQVHPNNGKSLYDKVNSIAPNRDEDGSST